MAEFDAARDAFQRALWLVHDTWIAEAFRQQTSLAYQDGIQVPVELASWSGVVRNTSPDASRIEEGSHALHLPSVIRWGQTLGSRLSKAGRYYLIVPFGHHAPRSSLGGTVPVPRQAMPRGIYAVARLLRPGQHLTAGPSRGAARHAPGMTPYVPRNPLNVRPGYTHASIYEGMRRTPSARGGSSYTTFRTMTQDSPGWWLPARPGKPIPEEVVRTLAPVIQSMMDEALLQDVVVILQAGLGG